MFHEEMLKDFQSTLKSRTLAAACSFLAQRMACVFSHRRGNIAPDVLDFRVVTHTYLLNTLIDGDVLRITEVLVFLLKA